MGVGILVAVATAAYGNVRFDQWRIFRIRFVAHLRHRSGDSGPIIDLVDTSEGAIYSRTEMVESTATDLADVANSIDHLGDR